MVSVRSHADQHTHVSCSPYVKYSTSAPFFEVTHLWKHFSSDSTSVNVVSTLSVPLAQPYLVSSTSAPPEMSE